MTDHVHTWSPVPGETAQYVCECAATGYRNSRGVIVAHKTRRVYAERWTAASGIVGKLPSLDQQEKK